MGRGGEAGREEERRGAGGAEGERETQSKDKSPPPLPAALLSPPRNGGGGGTGSARRPSRQRGRPPAPGSPPRNGVRGGEAAASPPWPPATPAGPARPLPGEAAMGRGAPDPAPLARGRAVSPAGVKGPQKDPRHGHPSGEPPSPLPAGRRKPSPLARAPEGRGGKALALPRPQTKEAPCGRRGSVRPAVPRRRRPCVRLSHRDRAARGERGAIRATWPGMSLTPPPPSCGGRGSAAPDERSRWRGRLGASARRGGRCALPGPRARPHLRSPHGTPQGQAGRAGAADSARSRSGAYRQQPAGQRTCLRDVTARAASGRDFQRLSPKGTAGTGFQGTQYLPWL